METPNCDVWFQFEEDMLKIGMKILDLNHKHIEDPDADVAARSDAAYISRIISAMVQLTRCPPTELLDSDLKREEMQQKHFFKPLMC